MIDARIAFYILWGGGVLIASVVVLTKRWSRFQNHRNDRRRAVRRDVRKDVMSGVALFLTALGASLAIAFVMFGEAGSGLRGFAVALALGAFFGALLVMATEEDANGEAPHDGRHKA